MKNAMLGAALTLLAATPATAQQWSGPSIGIGIGVATLSADATANGTRTDTIGVCNPADCGPTFLPLIDLTTAQGFSGGVDTDPSVLGTIQLGYDQQIAPQVVVGVFADADWSNGGDGVFGSSGSTVLTIPIIPVLPPIGLGEASLSGTIEQDWSWTVGGRVGYLVTPHTLIYGLAGYTRVELSNSQVTFNAADPLGIIPALNSPASLTIDLPDALDGYTVGGGIETSLTGNLGLKLEYRYSDLGSASGSAKDGDLQCCLGPFARDIAASATAGIDAQEQSIRAVLVYRFGSDPAGDPLK